MFSQASEARPLRSCMRLKAGATPKRARIIQKCRLLSQADDGFQLLSPRNGLTGVPFSGTVTDEMIRSFADKRTAAIFSGRMARGLPSAVQDRARAKLLAVDAAAALSDLRMSPGNRLEALLGDRKGQHSIRVNRRRRVLLGKTAMP